MAVTDRDQSSELASLPEEHLRALAQRWRTISGAGTPFAQFMADLDDYFSHAIARRKVMSADEAIRLVPPPQKLERPDPDWVRGICPHCGEEVVANCYYIHGHNKGGAYIIVWECWNSLAEPPLCDFRRVL